MSAVSTGTVCPSTATGRRIGLGDVLVALLTMAIVATMGVVTAFLLSVFPSETLTK